jgi:hypothetical protein
MVKSRTTAARSIRPPGRNPVISGRVPPSLHQQIQAAAQASGRSMSEEMAARIEWANRLLGSGDSGRAIEMAALAFLFAGERTGREEGVTDWTKDLRARRQAVLAACVSLMTQFLTDDPDEQYLTLESLKGRLWTRYVNQPKRDEGRQS